MAKSEHKIRINMSDWDLGGWPDLLGSAIEIDCEKDAGGNVELTFSLDPASFDNAARKVGEQAIESFLENSLLATITPLGLSVRADELPVDSDDEAVRLVVPWSHCFIFGGQAAVNQLVSFLRQQVDRSGFKWPGDAE